MVRLSARAAGVAVMLLWLVVVGSPAGWSDPPRDAGTSADAAVTWVAAQSIEGASLEQQLDLALAYEVAGAPASHVDPLLDGVDFLLGQGESAQTRVLAKAVIALGAAGRPTVVQGGRDIGAELRRQLGKPPGYKGQYASPAGDELISQAWGMLADARLGGGLQDQTDYLASRQCPDGHFAAVPDIQGCGQSPDMRAQAMALHALVAAQHSGIPVGGRVTAAVRWFQARSDRSLNSWPDVAASSLAWFVTPLMDVGESAAARQAQAQLMSLQLLDGRADDRLVGAIGGENSLLMSQLVTQNLTPSTWLSVDAVMGLRPANLVTLAYRPRAELASLALPGPRIVTVSQVSESTSVTVLAQGFAPDDALTLTIAGLNGRAATATTDATGCAQMAFTTRSLPDRVQRLSVTGTGAVATTDLRVVEPLSGTQPDAGGVVDAAQDGGLTLSLGRALLIGGLAVVVLMGVAWVTRERTG